ncbi:hypothetical protein [Persicobacter psychrovividus]|uniref:Secretion system C-terminal sorting domain-containing protein n=1 Tax=Persicobacter psychrovividus TaxID=387638 RepID=A0ABM7VEW7_9BACT|nr:hypothetical protein PEPS_17740 [Persicobacter psychrovividus]
MVKLFGHLLLLFVIGAQSYAQEQTLQVKGLYQGRNVYVQNPQIPNDRFATQAVFLNGQKVLGELTSSTFTVDLSHLQKEDSVNVVIQYLGGQPPKVVNPQVLRAKVKFDFAYISLENDVLRWAVHGYGNNGVFIVQQYKNKQWEIVGSRSGEKIMDEKYDFPVSLTKGTNRFRVRFLTAEGKSFYSQVVSKDNFDNPIEIFPARVSTKLYLNRPVTYDVEDAFGNLVKSGQGKEVDMSAAETGLYYLIVGDQRKKFFKK